MVTFLPPWEALVPTVQSMLTMGRRPLSLGMKRSLDMGKADQASWCCLSSVADSSRSCTLSKCCLQKRAPGHMVGAGHLLLVQQAAQEAWQASQGTHPISCPSPVPVWGPPWPHCL